MLASAQHLDNRLSRLTHYWHVQEDKHALLMSIANIVVFLAIFLCLDKIVMGLLVNIPEAGYDQDFLVITLMESILTSPLLLTIAVVASVIVLYRWSWISATWEHSGFPQSIRIFIVFVAAIMSWACATYDYNLFLDRYYHLDRLLLLLAVPCIYWRPTFLIPYLSLLPVYIAQYTLAIGGYSWAEFSMLIGMLISALVVLLLRAFIQRNWSVQFLLFAVCLITSHYWIPGVGKYNLSWHQFDEVYRLLPNTYANGWMPWLDVDQVSRLTRWIATANTPLRLGTLILEWGILFVLWRKKSLQAFLICWIAFHLSIFATSGIFFWKWISLEVAFLVTLQFVPKHFFQKLFTTRNFVIAMVLIAGSGSWSHATNLAWLDMPMTYTYRFTAVTETNQRYTLPPAFFGPYDYQFTLGRFGFLSKQPALRIVWGATTDLGMLKLANQAVSPQDVLDLELNHGTIYYDEEKVKEFDRFMVKFLEAYNHNGGKPGFYRPIKAPRQLWTFPGKTAMPDGSIIHTVYVEQVLSFFDGQKYMEIEKRPIHKVTVRSQSL